MKEYTMANHEGEFPFWHLIDWQPVSVPDVECSTKDIL